MWVSGCGRRGLVFFELACCPHSFRLFIPENMAKEQVAKLVVGNDSGTCKASFAGDVPKIGFLVLRSSKKKQRKSQIQKKHYFSR